MPTFTPLPVAAGIGLRAPHHREVLETSPPLAWCEVHSENFFAEGGAALHFLDAIRERYPLSLHGVGASLGGFDMMFERHLEKLARLVARVEPAAVSEHLCWSSSREQHFNDLLPLPCTQAALTQVCERVDRLQMRLGRQILVENVSTYLLWKEADYRECDFLVEVAKHTGCGLLLDINNLYVSACNHGWDANAYLEAIPAALVGEIHLAGYALCDDFLIDTHGQAVQPEVWALYQQALGRWGARPTLIEWDTDIPPLATLMAEADAAERHLRAHNAIEEADHAVA